ncbi:MAG: MoaD/ThiS family protein [Candidatus Hydrogenedentes bacterium]|nr:MoaD/ThiS family protein [Candidatus Hydrogenedentota bacterium]
MQVTMRYFGQLRHLAGRDEDTIHLETGVTALSAIRAAMAPYGEAAALIVMDASGALRPSLMVLINDAPIDKETPPTLQSGDIITLLCAISGG